MRALQIELPAERELRRVVHTALHGFFHDIYTRVTARLPEAVRVTFDQLLEVGPEESVSRFEQLKTPPAAPTIAHLQQEITKLQTLRALGVPADALADVPEKVVTLLQRRASNERAGEMRAHPAPIRYALMACFIHGRTMEVTDDVVRMLLEIIRRIDTQTEKHLQKELVRDIKRVTGKVQLLYRIAEAVVEEPDGTIRTVLFPQVKEETFRDLAAEAKASGPQYRIWYQYVMRQKYVHHYRQMLPWVLEHLTFRSENRFQPVIEALGAIKQALGTKTPYLPDEVPLEGVVLPSWRDTVLEEQDGAVRVNRQYYELCVLQRLERALKCKEIWVEGASAFRNPSHDMPANWQQEAQRVAYYQGLAQPVEVSSFIDPLREQLTQTLTWFNRDLPRNPSVRLTTPAANDDRRLFAVDRLTAQPEPQSLDRIKDLISQRYGMVDLLDIFVEAERLTAFTRFFTHSGTKEVRSRDALRPLLLLDLFAEGTNTGIKRVATANQRYGYDELLYVRKHYFSIDALRQANAAVVNKILALRNPRLWGEGSACASDGKRFESWRQNLMTEWRSRYKGYGVMIYLSEAFINRFILMTTLCEGGSPLQAYTRSKSSCPSHNISLGLQRLQPPQQLIILFPPRHDTWACLRCDLLKGGTLGFQRGLGIAVRGVQVGMPHPTADDGDVDPGSHEIDCCCVPKNMRGDTLGGQGGHLLRRQVDIPLEFVPHTGSSQGMPIAIHKEGFMGQAGLTAQESRQEISGLGPEGTETFLLALSEETYVSGGLEADGTGTEVQGLLDPGARVV